MYKLKPGGLTIIIALVLLFIILIGGFYYYINFLMLPVSAELQHEVEVEIPQGATTETIAHLLEEKGLIHSAFFFRNYLLFKDLDADLKAGKYLLNTGMTMKEIIDILQKGETVDEGIVFTIPEGYTIEQMAYYLEEKEIVTAREFLEASCSLQQYGEPAFFHDIPEGLEYPLEGYLFPDTYKIEKGAGAEEIVSMMLQRFDQAFYSEYYDRAAELEMTVHEVVTLASLIEREAVIPQERPLISAVFHNRLNKGMLLQSCATVQFALGEAKPVLNYKDLEIDSPYNTYIYHGLPPGPIASPGAASLHAALYPEEVDYLYFVAKEDGSGEHYFSTTISEHNRYKQKVQKNRMEAAAN